MTSGVTSVSETTELADIANLLETKRIKRVPVVRDGKLVGIVSRANLVRALAAAGSRLSADTDERRALRVAAENVTGVRSVDEHIVPAPLIPPAF
jgi:CBS domain-containing protein